jgi:hypothetical protein
LDATNRQSFFAPEDSRNNVVGTRESNEQNDSVMTTKYPVTEEEGTQARKNFTIVWYGLLCLALLLFFATTTTLRHHPLFRLNNMLQMADASSYGWCLKLDQVVSHFSPSVCVFVFVFVCKAG